MTLMTFRRARLMTALLAPLALVWLSGVTPAHAATALADTAIVITTEGDLLSLREGPGFDYAVLTAFAQGTVLAVLAGPVASADGTVWYEVSYEGLLGWCAAEYLAAPGDVASSFQIGATDGEGARLRDGPGFASAILLVMPQGAGVVLAGAAQQVDGTEWTPVYYDGVGGWVAAAFLLSSDMVGHSGAGATAALTQAATPGAGPLPVGGRAAVVGTDGFDLRIRGGVGVAAPVYAHAPEGAVVLVVNGPSQDSSGASWYGVDYDGIQGWVLGEYLLPTTAGLSRRQVLTTQLSATESASRGQAVADAALRYLGVPYLWGGETPVGWDCSGMIVYLYEQVAGLTLPRVSQDQFLVGRALAPAEVGPGDLVFFADTDGPGITHNGIALGDGRFIHARSAQYGTTISSLNDPYWIKAYAGARRP